MGRGHSGTISALPPRPRRGAARAGVQPGGKPVKAATILFVLWPREGNAEQQAKAAESGRAIARARNEDDGSELILKGRLGQVSAGQLLQIKRGEWRPDDRGGWFYDVKALDHQDPLTREALLSYLQRLPGVGETLAAAIVDHFGQSDDGSFDGRELLQKIDGDPSILAQVRSASGRAIGGDLEQLIGKWEQLRGERRVRLFLSSVGLGDSSMEKVIKAFGVSTVVDRLKENPYLLCEVEGIGFAAADRVARKLGFGILDERRIAYGLDWVLRHAEQDGHVCLKRAELLERAPELLADDGIEPSRELVEQIAEQMLAEGRLVAEPDPGDGIERLYAPELYLVETRLYRQLEQQLNVPPAELPTLLTRDPQLTDEQWQGVENGLTEKISILCGSAGTGKSSSLKGLLDALDAAGQSYVCLAPTGKAAKRVQEATGRPASTIHRRLGYRGLAPASSLDDEPEERRLETVDLQDPRQRTFSRPRPLDVVVIDEASMLDMRLAERVLSHLGDNTRLVLVGDPNQLPPVGCGSVLLDLLESERVPTARLTKIFRQAGDSLLVVNANRVKDGLEPYWTKDEAEAALGHAVKDDWRFVEVEDEEGALQATIAQIEQTAREIGIGETEVLVTAPSRKAKVGVYQLNRLLQERHNPHGEIVRGGELEPLRLGDVVMNTVNRYSPFRDSERYHDVMNGDMGRLVEWDSERKVAWVDFGEPQGPQPFTREEIGALDASYCATTHKLQGSEAPAIIAPLGPGSGASGRLSKELIYTAWTRAKQRCVVIASKDTIRAAIQRGAAAERETTLDLRVGRIAPRLKSRLEQLREIERRWQSYAAEQRLPRLRRARGGGVAREAAAA